MRFTALLATMNASLRFGFSANMFGHWSSSKRIYTFLALLSLLLITPSVSSASSSSSSSSQLSLATTTRATTTTATTVKQEEGGNVIFQVAGYIKDSIVRTVDGCRELARNHQICNQIRDKQKEHRERLRLQWEANGSLTKEEIKQRLAVVNGGISYDEYTFLAKGKDDRSKLMTILLMMWGAPRFLPYALMLYPEMLPSPFEPPPEAGSRETRLEKLVLKTLMQLERDARIIPAIAKFNIFGRNKQQLNLIRMEAFNNATAAIITKPEARGSTGAKLILQAVDHLVYSATEHTRGERCLVPIPKSIIKGLNEAITGSSNILSTVIPNFVTRGKVLSHIRKITESDEFLVHEKINLDSIGRTRLIEACDDRLVGGPGRSDDELRESLQDWLDVAVIQPEHRCQQTGQLFYNGNLARTVLMCYHAMDAVRDVRSASFLPRLLLLQEPVNRNSSTMESSSSSSSSTAEQTVENGATPAKRGMFF